MWHGYKGMGMTNSRGKFTCPNTDTEPHHEQMHGYMVTGSGNGNGMGIRMGTVTGMIMRMWTCASAWACDRGHGQTSGYGNITGRMPNCVWCIHVMVTCSNNTDPTVYT